MLRLVVYAGRVGIVFHFMRARPSKGKTTEDVKTRYANYAPAPWTAWHAAMWMALNTGNVAVRAAFKAVYCEGKPGCLRVGCRHHFGHAITAAYVFWAAWPTFRWRSGVLCIAIQNQRSQELIGSMMPKREDWRMSSSARIALVDRMMGSENLGLLGWLIESKVWWRWRAQLGVNE